MIQKYSSIIKTVFICAIIAAGIWFFISYKNLKEDKARNEENWKQERREDLVKFKSLELTTSQIQDYINDERKDLIEVLKMEKIKTNRIQSLLTQVLRYKDTTTTQQDFTSIIDAINKKENKKIPFVDSLRCYKIQGDLIYDDGKLTLDITNREFKNKTDVVAYWQRREWKFLFWKTRFLGKKEFTAKSFSECGDINTVKIEKAD